MKSLLLVLLIAVTYLTACQKHNNPVVTPTNPDTTRTTQPVDSTLALNLYYPDASGIIGNTFELIVSESGGTILLDSLAAFNTPVVITLKTKQSSVNVATVVYSASYSYYSVYIYKAVQPSQWVDALPGTPQNIGVSATTSSKIYYTNTPAVALSDVQTYSLPSSSTGLWYDATVPKQLDVTYNDHQLPNYTYLLLPTLGLYNWHQVKTANDTVDLTHMDTAVQVRYTVPSQYTFRMPYIFGYPDSTDPTKYLTLYNGDSTYSSATLQYPPKSKVPMQKYISFIDATTANKELINYQTYGDSVPPAVPYPASPVYSLTSTQNNNFSVSFSQKPTLYTAGWRAGNITIGITAPADSTSLQPLDLINSFKSKMLTGQSLSSLKLMDFSYTIVPGVDYNGYFVHQCDPSKVTGKPFPAMLYYDIAQ